MEWVNTILTGLFITVALLMILLILIQEGKGGGLAALGGTKAAGVEGVTNPVRKATAYLAGIFFFLAILLGWMHRPEARPRIDVNEPVIVAESPLKVQSAPEKNIIVTPKIEVPTPIVSEIPPADKKPDALTGNAAVKEDAPKEVVAPNPGNVTIPLDNPNTLDVP